MGYLRAKPSDGEDWQPWHRQQIGDILNLIAATQEQPGQNTGIDPIGFDRIVTAQGEPGTGFYKSSRIVRECFLGRNHACPKSLWIYGVWWAKPLP
jgi:hypothetical protein